MNDTDVQQVVVVVRYDGKIRWFRSDRDLWVLDINKWRDEFISNGYDVPEFTDSYRCGILAVNKENAKRFLDCMSEFELEKDQLSMELAKRYASARSWWDVGDLFPIMFVNIDDCKVGAFYQDGVKMERYISDGWAGEFIDFANEYPEEIFPTEEKFWVKGNSDLLKLLNERGASNQ